MSIQFILGRSGTGKTHRCVEAIVKALQQEVGPPLVFLVPEQATYQAERAILSHHDIAGFSRLRILSFDRLQFHLLGRSGAGQTELTRIGQQILVQKILWEQAGQLQVFGKVATEPGTAAELTRLLVELQYDVLEPEDLGRLVERLKNETHTATTLKIRDIQRVFLAYLDTIQHRHDELFNPDARLSLARTRLEEALWLKNAWLWIDGFSGFTGQELDLLAGLFKVVDQTKVALCLDTEALNLTCCDVDRLDPTSLFSGSERTYVQLSQLCDRQNIPVIEPIVLTESHRFKDAPDLAFIEQHLFQSIAELSPAPTPEHIALHLAPHRRAEVDYVARDICRRVRTEGLRYRDIAVVLSDAQGYDPLIEAAFGDRGIPYFVDRARTFSLHPVVELIQAAFQVVDSDFATSDVLAYLKTGLGPLEADDVDRLENYCLAFGIEGIRWLSKTDWTFAQEQAGDFADQAIDGVRRKAVKALATFYTALGGRTAAQTTLSAQVFVQALWTLVEDLNIPQRLAQAGGKNDPNAVAGAPELWRRSDEHRQLMDKLVRLLDECVEILGSEPIPCARLSSIVSQAMHQLTLKRIPPSLDQVLVGSIERSRHPEIKVLYILGATQRQFPMPVVYDTVLTEEDRTLAAEHDFVLSDTLQHRLTDRQYLAYIAFTRASQALVVTVPAVDAKGSVEVVSPFVERLQRLLGQASLSPIPKTTLETATCASELALGLCEELSRDADLYSEKTQILGEAISLLQSHSDSALQRIGHQVMNALAYDNHAYVTQDTARALMGQALTFSASRLSSFAACPYQHFARYGLRLRRREILGLEPMDMGTLYHDVLDQIHKTLAEYNQSLATVTQDDLHSITDKSFDQIVNQSNLLQQFAAQSAHHAFVMENTRRTLQECVAELAEMVQASVFIPTASEIAFGPDSILPPVEVQLTDGRVITLQGRLDRIDLADTDGETLALIIDYKRSARSFKWGQFVYGLDIQLPVYILALDKAQIRDKTIGRCVGAFMIPIEASMTKVSNKTSDTEPFKRKARGVFNGDYVNALETQSPKMASQYWSYYMKQGEPYGRFEISALLRPEEFDRMRTHTRGLIQELVERLLVGEIQVLPFRLQRRSPCAHCDYRALCKFDWQVNDYRPFQVMSKSEVLAQMEGGYD